MDFTLAFTLTRYHEIMISLTLLARYLNKKKEAEEITQEYEAKPSADYSLKEGETLRLQLKNVSACKYFESDEVFHI